MRLRTRFSEEMLARLAASLPEAVLTAWDAHSVVVVVEQLTFLPAGGVENGYERVAKLSGVMRAELRADRIDDMAIEPLIASLVGDPVFLPFLAVPPGALAEKARLILTDWRDTIRDVQIASALRFSVDATLAVRAAPLTATERLMLGEAPQIGPGHEADYADLTAGEAP